MRSHLLIHTTLLSCFATGLLGQTISDSWTPRELAAGTPAGSYALTGFDTVDPYSGSSSLHIPLLQIGGRGEAGYDTLLLIQQKWQVGAESLDGGTWYYPQALSFLGANSFWAPYINRYSPGLVLVRETTDTTQTLKACTSGPGSGYSFFPGTFLTRLTFIDEYGTEHELVDTQTTGQPLSPYSPPGYQPNCEIGPNSGPTRGTIFRSTDATDLLFISDSAIQEQIAVPTSDPEMYPVYATGWLLFPDGRKYQVVNGLITAIEDRNGNRTTLTNGGYGPTTITDSIGRVTQISYADLVHTFSDTITYPASNGSQQQIVITYTEMSNALASGWSLQTEQQLFPTLDGASSGDYNPYLPQSVKLADGSYYYFAYNSYGELASITLPTGGVITYQFPSSGQQSSSCNGSPVFCVTTVETFRRILSRNEYSDGHTLSRQTLYSASDANPDQYGNTVATETDEDGLNNTLRVTKHHYQGDAWYTVGKMAPGYPEPLNGMETLTEMLNASQQSLRERLETWTERPCGSGENCWWVSEGVPMDHDPQVCQKFTTLLDTSPSQSAAVLYGYDQYNNATDIYEYDYGQGPAPSTSCQSVSSGWTRHTSTSYLPITNSSYAGYSTSNPVASAWLLQFPSDKQILDPSLGKVAETQYNYDTTSISNDPNINGNWHDNANFAGAGTRGNLTGVSGCLNASSCSWITSAYYFDIAGNQVSAVDANSNTTSYSFADNYSDGQNRNSYGFP